MNHNHVFIAVPKDDAGVDIPHSVIFGTRKADEGNFTLINITCQNDHLKFENLDETPEVRWSADISGEDIGKKSDFSGRNVDATNVEDFILKESSKLKCPTFNAYGKFYKSNPLTTAMFFLWLSNFEFHKNTGFGKLEATYSGSERIPTSLTWTIVTSGLNSKVTEKLVRESLKEESRAWMSDFKVDFQDGTDPQTIFTTKNAILGGTALAAAGLGVGAVVHRKKLQRLFESGHSNEVATNSNKRTQQGGGEGAHGSKSLRTLLKDYERLNIRQACAEGRVDPANVAVWANRSGLWRPVDISGLWGRKLKQSLCGELVMGMFGLSRAQYEAMLHNGDLTAAITVYRHKKRDHYVILLRLPVKIP